MWLFGLKKSYQAIIRKQTFQIFLYSSSISQGAFTSLDSIIIVQLFFDMRMSKILLLICFLTVCLCECPWSHVVISHKGQKLPSCDATLHIQVSFQDGEYTQGPYNTTNTNISTPFTLSTLHFTKNGITEDFVATRFHFHHIGKNVVDGKIYDIEIHIIHGGKKSNLVLSIFFEAEDGDFPDPFDNWVLDSHVPISQKFPIKLSTPEKALYYDNIPNCNFTFGVAFVFNMNPIKIKQSTLQKIGKLIDDTKPFKVEGEGNFFVQEDVCQVARKGKGVAIHHRLRLAQ